MYIYYLRRVKNANFEQLQACVVIAPDDIAARGFAAEACLFSADRSLWLHESDEVEILLLGTALPYRTPGVVVSDVNYG